ncbi:hypothetical protein F5Y17DRAFT_181338 [Xylariaceae sp. FL0594]|nr:hypothetical protein F5Y17DRAFT_181338 [Xylariaceae sp. FL0594]
MDRSTHESRLAKSRSFCTASPPRVRLRSASFKLRHGATNLDREREGKQRQVVLFQTKALPHQTVSVGDLRRSFEKHTKPISPSVTPQEAQSYPSPAEHAVTPSMAPVCNTKGELHELSLGEPLFPVAESEAGGLQTELLTEQDFLTSSAIKADRHGLAATARVRGTSLAGQGRKHTSLALPETPSRSLVSCPAKGKPFGTPQRGANANTDPLPETRIGNERMGTHLPDTPRPHRTLGGLDGIEESCLSGTGKRPKAFSSTSGPAPEPSPGAGKVSQLRRLFEQSSRRISASVSFTNLRSRPSREDPITGSRENGTLRPHNNHTGMRGLNAVPSLTTEISMNDFFCDFSDSQVGENSTVSASPYRTAPKSQAQAKQASPVKRRIQQFEHLSRESLNLPNPDTGMRSTARRKENKVGGRRNTGRSWGPIQEKGATIWRKISDSFGRSLESLRISNDQARSTDSPDLSIKPEGLSPADAQHHRGSSSSFGYRLCRIAHKSRSDTLSSDLVSSPLDRGCNHSPLCTDHSLLHLDHDGAATARPTSWDSTISDGVGLDGQLVSKKTKAKEVEPSGPSPLQADSNALVKAMLKQSAEERDRRKQDERYLHRDKKPRRLSIWKDKGKGLTVDPTCHSADGTSTAEEGGGRSDRPKGKDKGKAKEKRKEEGQAPRDTKQHQKRSTTEECANDTTQKTESGFAVFETKDVKLRHPKPSRPGQVRRMANMYKEKDNSGMSLNTNSKASSGTSFGETRQSFMRKATSALGLGGRKEDAV